MLDGTMSILTLLLIGLVAAVVGVESNDLG
jgi:hypothetical protein